VTGNGKTKEPSNTNREDAPRKNRRRVFTKEDRIGELREELRLIDKVFAALKKLFRLRQ
jgi:hypothetical protein